MSSKSQKDIVFEIVKNHQPVRTEQVKVMAMQAGVSCADRYLRWLQEEHLIFSEKHPKDRTKTWRSVAGLNLYPETQTGSESQLVMRGVCS